MSALEIHCSQGHLVLVPPENLQQRLACPVCQVLMHVSLGAPGEPTIKFEVKCPSGHLLRVKEKYLHQVIYCSSCQQAVRIDPSRLLTSADLSPNKNKER